MKKVVSFICTVAVLTYASTVFAQDLSIDGEVFKRWYVQGDIGYAFPVKDKLDNKDSTIFGARLGKMINENLSIETQYRYTQYDLSNDDEFGDTPLTGSKITSNMLLLNAKLGAMIFTANEKFYPYVLAGAGYSFNNWTGAVSRSSNTVFEMDDSFMFQGGLGVDYFVSNDFVVNMEVSRIWNKPDAEIKESNGTVSTGDIEIGNTSITAGFRMLF